jgi:hypothetical protein
MTTSLPVGQDKDGVVWKFDKNSDFRYDLLERGGLIK